MPRYNHSWQLHLFCFHLHFFCTCHTLFFIAICPGWSKSAHLLTQLEPNPMPFSKCIPPNQRTIDFVIGAFLTLHAKVMLEHAVLLLGLGATFLMDKVISLEWVLLLGSKLPQRLWRRIKTIHHDDTKALADMVVGQNFPLYCKGAPNSQELAIFILQFMH